MFNFKPESDSVTRIQKDGVHFSAESRIFKSPWGNSHTDFSVHEQLFSTMMKKCIFQSFSKTLRGGKPAFTKAYFSAIFSLMFQDPASKRSKQGLVSFHPTSPAWVRSPRGDSITGGWLKPDFVKEILVRPMISSTSTTTTSSQSLSCMGRLNSFKPL